MDIKLSGVKNIRDFSEYGYSGFIRSAHLNKLTRKDARILKERYGLKTVIDLRTSQEVKERPDVKIAGVEYIHIPIFDGAIPGVSHENSTDRFSGSIPDMPEMYRLMVTSEEYSRQFMKALKVINERSVEGAVLWHCTEGKDRCGIVSALFLLSKGIDKQAVVDEYLLTNRVNKAKARRFYALSLLLGRGREFASRVGDAFLAKRGYIEPIMYRLTQMAGSFAKGGE